MTDWKEAIRKNQRHEAQLVKVCQPLVDSLNIPSFGYSRLYKDGRLSWLNRIPEWDPLFFECELYHQNPYICDPDFVRDGVVQFGPQDMTCAEAVPEAMRQAMETIGIDHGLFFKRRGPDYVDYYSFSAGSSASRPGQASPLSDVALLHTFVKHFDIECAAMKQAILEHPIDIRALKGESFHQAEHGPDTLNKREAFLDALGYAERMKWLGTLAPREQDTLELYALRLPQRQIAKQLGISLRTVEHYIESIRLKLAIDEREELIQAGELLRLINGL